MINLDQVEKILSLADQGLSQRKIAHCLGISRNTIRRVLSDSGRYLHPERRGYRLIKGRPSRVLTESMKQGIEQMLVEDKAKARSKRRTSRQLYLEATRELGYQGAESTLRRYIGTLRPRLNRVWIPLEFSPGEAAQVDWTEWTVEIADRVETIHLFCYRLCYSRAIWVQAYWSENRESLLDGLCNAFSYTGGTTRRLIFDNLKTAVHSGAGKKATEQREFTAFRLYYGMTADFCNAGEAHEKGQVEHVAKVAKRELVSGINRVSSIGELNKLLAERCRQYLERRVPDGEETVAERLQAERKVLRALPEHQWECCFRTYVKVNTSALVQYQTNRYSVPWHRAGKQVLVKAYPDQIEIWDDNELIARHNRAYGKRQSLCQLDHYLDILLRRPRALGNSRAYRQAELPAEFGRLFDRLTATDPLDGPREMVRVLMLTRKVGVKELARAIGRLLDAGLLHYDALRSLLNINEQVIVPGLPQVTVNQPLPARYDVLLGGEPRS